MIRLGLLVSCVYLLAACASRPGPDVLHPSPLSTVAQAQPSDDPVRVFLATTRATSEADRRDFSAERSSGLNYASFDVSIPPVHKPSEIEWPKGAPDPARDFVTLDRQSYDAGGFVRALGGERAGRTDVVLYVHGFNTSLPEAVYRAAQISHDADRSAVPVVFAWPSEARMTAYVADRDAADYSRPYLAELITRLASSKRIGRFFIVAHSMGGRLTMETLMQLRLAGRRDVLNRLEVVLADPDIDMDLFWEQVRITGRLDPPLTVVVAPDDRALMMSQMLAAGNPRIGKADLSDPQIAQHAADLGVRLVDISSLESDAIGHSRIDQLAALYDQLPAGQAGSNLRSAGAFFFEAIGLGFTRFGQGLSP